MNGALFSETTAPSDERLTAYEVNYTPIGVVRKTLGALKAVVKLDVKTFLDPSAGAGVYCQVVRELWPTAKIYAVEPRGEERDQLVKVADEVLVAPFDPLAWLPKRFDLIATNPPFTFTRAWIAEILDNGLCNNLFLLDKTQAFQRSAEGVGLMRRHCPTAEFRIGQSIRFRTQGSGDGICYSSWFWSLERWLEWLEEVEHCTQTGEELQPRWTSYQLPLLSSQERSHS